VEGLDFKGLVTQGRSIEEAIYMAHDAAKLLAEARADIAAEKIAERKTRAKAKKRTAPGRRQLAKA
jgi:predicted RNase H-like HicB family nuclease